MMATFNDVFLEKTILSWEHIDSMNNSVMKSKRTTKTSKNLSMLDSKVMKKSPNSNHN
jgi:hypothetical protein